MSAAVIDKPAEIVSEGPWIHCDRDSACDQAKYRVETLSGPLYFCGHHYHQYGLLLLGKGYKVEAL